MDISFQADKLRDTVSENSFYQEEFRKKIFAAEHKVAIVRLFLVVKIFIIYLFTSGHIEDREKVAYFVVSAALIYSFYILFAKPYRRFSFVNTIYFTSITDSILISCWIYCTGGYMSSWFPLWYISLVAIGLRYSTSITVSTGFFYLTIYLILVFADNHSMIYYPDLIIRSGFIILISVLAGFSSGVLNEYLIANLIIRQSKEEIHKRETQLKEAHVKLEEKVKERTEELMQSNIQLLKEIGTREDVEKKQRDLIFNLDENNKELKRINEDLDNFVYSASHDLKSPITNIESLVQLLYEDENISSESSEFVRKKLDYSFEKIRKTIEHLASVARAEKKVYDDQEVILIKYILDEVIRENEEVFNRAEARVSIDLRDEGKFICSRSCVKSLLYNLLTNSIKYKQHDKLPLISIRTLIINNSYTIIFSDNGLGMDLKKNGHKLFKIFHRFHDHVEGTGIGLYIVRRMIEKNNGKITVESIPGQGTTFLIEFQMNPQ